MNILGMILTVLGLVVFETVSSIDNAIINAQVLSTMSQKAKKWFLFYGLFFAVFVVRGLLPWFIVWMVNPVLGPIGALTATFSNDPAIAESIEKTAPILLMGGGVFLLFLFFHWLFLEEKNFGLHGEKFFMKHGVWFYAIVSILLSIIVWYGMKIDPVLGFAAVVGSTGFFITHGFKQNAEQAEKKLMTGNMSDVSKILFLEIIDISFSIDGVLGAFAFTLSVPLILLGNGIGAFVVRELTIGNIERIKKYAYLGNGAMYSVFFLSLVMLGHAFHYPIPEWLSPILTIGTIVYFFLKSRNENKANVNTNANA
ncbi:MAG: DUF475 domain-containing protein [Patescibacteria group bacterium]